MGKSAKWFLFFFSPGVPPCLSQLGMCRYCGAVSLAPASLSEADGSRFVLPKIRLFIWAREAERRASRRSPGGAVTHLPWHRLWSYWRSPARMSRGTRHTAGTGASEATREKKTSAPGSCLTPLTTLWLTFKNHSRDARAPPALAACGWRASRRKRSKRFLPNALENMGKQSW